MSDESDHVLEAISPLGLSPLVHNNAAGARNRRVM